MTGRYAHNPDPHLAELLHRVSLDGWANDSTGDLDHDGFYASLLIVEPAEQHELTDAFDHPIPAGNWVLLEDVQGFVTEDFQGFVTLDQHPTVHAGCQAFTRLQDNWTGPREDDSTITRRAARQPLCGRARRPVPRHATDLDQAEAMLREAMDSDRYWPDAWFTSDHGNPDRLDLTHSHNQPTPHPAPAAAGPVVRRPCAYRHRRPVRSPTNTHDHGRAHQAAFPGGTL